MAGAANSRSLRGRQSAAAAAPDTVSISSSRDRMEQAPRHRSYLVEELESDFGSGSIDNPCVSHQPKVCIDLLGRCVCNSPVIEPISSSPSVALAEIGGDRGCGPNHLVSKRPKRRLHPSYERQGQACGFEGCRMRNQAFDGGRVVHGYLRVVHTPPNVDGWPDVKGRPTTGLRGRLALYIGPPIDYPSLSERPGGDHITATQ